MIHEPDEQFAYLIELDLPHPQVAALMALAADPTRSNLYDAWEVWVAHEYRSTYRDTRSDLFAEVVEELTGQPIVTCRDCQDQEWQDEAQWVGGGYGGYVCQGCLEEYYYCDACEEYASSATNVEGEYYCDSCLENHAHWCDECHEWYANPCDHEPEGCDCSAPHQRFTFPANGRGSIANDERLEVVLPAGTIDEAGRGRIRDLLRCHVVDLAALYKVLEAIGDQWQTKQGNYTRRLSRELYKSVGVKLGDHVISEVGNLARQHSSTTSEWHIEVTRDLNLPAYAFVHEDSCWWQSYYPSRCALKNWGGIGLRAFDENGNPRGRAWVQPVDADLQPTHDAMGAHGYVIYNCYGTISEYQAARIVAHLSSNTYKRVGLSSSPQYVNGDFGILVAPEATCQATSGVAWHADAHDKHDAGTIDRTGVAA